MDVSKYIKPELMILIPVLYALGVLIKNSRVSDFLIPFILGIAGIALAVIWMLATQPLDGVQAVLSSIFTGVTQGILCSAASVYVNQLIKQGIKKN